MVSENVKKRVNRVEVPYHLQVWECPPPQHRYSPHPLTAQMSTIVRQRVKAKPGRYLMINQTWQSYTESSQFLCHGLLTDHQLKKRLWILALHELNCTNHYWLKMWLGKLFSSVHTIHVWCFMCITCVEIQMYYMYGIYMCITCVGDTCVIHLLHV